MLGRLCWDEGGENNEVVYTAQLWWGTLSVICNEGFPAFAEVGCSLPLFFFLASEWRGNRVRARVTFTSSHLICF